MYARKEIVNGKKISTYHCVSRCVRRAFLCGKDPYTGKSFEHRKKWVSLRLCALLDVFAVELVAYAVMSNHVHSLVRIRPDVAKGWSPEEVARRWRTILPRHRGQNGASEPSEEEIRQIVSKPELVEIYRKRLTSISWFFRFLNEYIARKANHEDDCKGRFWEGRFRCQRVYDVSGILTCSSYIDLNPIRAGIAKTPEQSKHTSIRDRIYLRQKKSFKSKIPLVPIPEISKNCLTLDDYITLVDTTGRLLVEGKASIPRGISPILERLEISGEHWVETEQELRRLFPRVIGPARMIEQAAVEAKKSWFHGLSAARAIFKRN